MRILEVDSVSVHYGRIRALSAVNISIECDEIVTLIGSNGAGKTTLMRAVSGLRRASAGRIRFGGADISKLRADTRVAAGLSHVPEGRGVFPAMTTLENLEMGAYRRRDHRAVRSDIAAMLDLFPVLASRSAQKAGTLSGGEQQMLAVGRALMSRPKLLMLDEPSMGLSPQLIAQIFSIVRRIRDDGVTVLLVEQNAHQALQIADRAYVLETGTIVREGAGVELLEDRSVIDAYLGAV